MNGNGNIVALLERIAAGQDELHDEVRVLRGDVVQANMRLEQTNVRIDQTISRLDETIGRLDETNSRLGHTNRRLDETNSRLDQTNGRLDHLIGFLGKHHADHEQRLAALESAVFQKSG